MYIICLYGFLSQSLKSRGCFQMSRKHMIQHQKCDWKYFTPSFSSKKVIKLTLLSRTAYWQWFLPWSIKKLLEIDNGNYQSKQVFLYLVDIKALILYWKNDTDHTNSLHVKRISSYIIMFSIRYILWKWWE